MTGGAGRRAVTVLSGFLGSGKTTLLRRYLDTRETADIAVIINEYGAVGLDHHLVRMTEEQSILLPGGCVCCTRRDDLVRTLRDLLDLEQGGVLRPMPQIIIETSGIADPVPVLFTLATDLVLKHHFAPPSVVVTLDTLNAAAQIAQQPEIRKQIVAADRVVLTKADMAAWDAVSRCRLQVRALNPTARITVSRLGDGFDALAPADRIGVLPQESDVVLGAPHTGVRSTALGFTMPIDWPAFSIWLGMLLQARGPEVLRVKGLLDIGDAGPVVMNAAQHVVHTPEHLAGWPDAVQRPFLVFITRGIDPEQIAISLETFQCAGGREHFSVDRLR